MSESGWAGAGDAKKQRELAGAALEFRRRAALNDPGAIENNRDVQRAATVIASAEALERRSRAAWLPSAAALVTETVNDSELAFGGNVAQPKDQFALTGSFYAPLYAPAAWAATGQAGDRVEVSRLSAADVRKQVAVAAARAYLAVIAQHRQVQVDETARDNAKAQLDFAEPALPRTPARFYFANTATTVAARVLVDVSRGAPSSGEPATNTGPSPDLAALCRIDPHARETMAEALEASF